MSTNAPLNISETVRDRALVPKDHQQELVYLVFPQCQTIHIHTETLKFHIR